MNKEFLNEEQYQKSKKKISTTGTILLVTGIVMFLFGIIMAFGFQKHVFFLFTLLGLFLIGIGSQAKLLGHGREITAYLAQQQIPIAKEGIEKMAPTAKKVAKEITKGIKEGLKDEEE